MNLLLWGLCVSNAEGAVTWFAPGKFELLGFSLDICSAWRRKTWIVFRNGTFSEQSPGFNGWWSHNGHVLGRLSRPVISGLDIAEWTWWADWFLATWQPVRIPCEFTAYRTFQSGWDGTNVTLTVHKYGLSTGKGRDTLVSPSSTATDWTEGWFRHNADHQI